MAFQFWNYNNKKNINIQLKENEKWKDIAKKLNNEAFNSVWEHIDDGDGIIQTEEIAIFNFVCNWNADGKAFKNKDTKSFNKVFQDDYVKEQINNIKNRILKFKQDIHNKQKNWQNRDYSWSEGIERNIQEIKLGTAKYGQEIYGELAEIGKEVGFEVSILPKSDADNLWLEDYFIRRNDGKVYVLPEINVNGKYRQKTADNPKSSKTYKDAFPVHELVQGKSYLEGGNVLNHRLNDGTPSAIIGEDSIKISLDAMKLDDTEENRNIIKKQIAEDLGLNVNNIAFIPQFDFHIDMYYRPLKNGEIIVPDFDEGIKMLESIAPKYIEEGETESIMENNIARLKETRDNAKSAMDAAEKELISKGYTIKKLPAFGEYYANYSNGICGTDNQNNKYIITNKSEYPELDEQIIKYYKKIGIDKVFFVSSQYFLGNLGGIDCLTQEM